MKTIDLLSFPVLTVFNLETLLKLFWHFCPPTPERSYFISETRYVDGGGFFMLECNKPMTEKQGSKILMLVADKIADLTSDQIYDIVNKE